MLITSTEALAAVPVDRQIDLGPFDIDEALLFLRRAGAHQRVQLERAREVDFPVSGPPLPRPILRPRRARSAACASDHTTGGGTAAAATAPAAWRRSAAAVRAVASYR